MSASMDQAPAEPTWSRPSARQLAAYRALPAAIVGDALDRMPVLDAGIAHLAGPSALVGPALTVLTRPGDNLAIYHALARAVAGDVLVVAGRGCTTRALLGDLLAQLLIERGVAGVVIDGAVRDVGGLTELGLPTFARGACAAGPFKHGPGRVGVPVAVGGVVVQPGDLMVCDRDGVVVVPATELDTTLDTARTLLDREADVRLAIAEHRDVLSMLLSTPSASADHSRRENL